MTISCPEGVAESGQSSSPTPTQPLHSILRGRRRRRDGGAQTGLRGGKTRFEWACMHARAFGLVWDAHVFLADSLSGRKMKQRGSNIPCLRAEIKRLRLMAAPISLLSYFLCIVEAARRLVWRGIKMSACTAVAAMAARLS